jgi:hypothetical protein
MNRNTCLLLQHSVGCGVLLLVLSTCAKGTSGDPCTPDPCNGHATACGNSSGTALCLCSEGYTGATCLWCDTGYYEYPNGSGKCVDDPCLPDPCNAHQYCNNAPGIAVCACLAGYTGSTCSSCDVNYYEYPAGSGTCIDDPCQPDPCNGHGYCANSTGIGVCTCSLGYTGASCHDCAAGFIEQPTGSGTCVEDTDIGTTCNPDPCNGHGVCENSGGHAVCVCASGYDGARCNRCSTGDSCPAGNYCDSSGYPVQCLPQGAYDSDCRTDIECLDNICMNGKCIYECNSRTCPSDSYCGPYRGWQACQKKKVFAGPCDADTECLSDFCAPFGSGDLGSGSLGFCSKPCTSYLNCPDFAYCNLSAVPGRCGPQVDFGEDCTTDPQCLDGMCWEGKCTSECSSGTCPTGSYCDLVGVPEICIAQKSFADTCAKDVECVDNVCAPVDPYDSSTDAPRFCSNECTTHMDCLVTYYCDAATDEVRMNCLIGGIPGQACHSNRECLSPKICTLVNIGGVLSVECRSPTAGTLNVGETCVTSNAGQCKSNLCLSDSAFPTTPYCTSPCQLDSDCMNGLTCQRNYFSTSSLVVDICKKTRT